MIRPARAAEVRAAPRNGASSRPRTCTGAGEPARRSPCAPRGLVSWNDRQAGSKGREQWLKRRRICASGSRISCSYCRSQHLARQHLVPVIHEAQIAAIVAPEILQVVAERLPFGEMLLEGAEACIHRVAAHIDDGWRRGKMAWIRPTWLKLFGILSMKCGASPTQRRRLLDVASAELAEMLRAEARAHDLRIAIVRRRRRDRTRARW